jgi:hypothetical protein
MPPGTRKTEMVELPGGDPYIDVVQYLPVDAVIVGTVVWPIPPGQHQRLMVVYHHDPSVLAPPMPITFRIAKEDGLFPGSDDPHWLGSELVGVDVYHVYVIPRMA